jgi:hypothetical protein
MTVLSGWFRYNILPMAISLNGSTGWVNAGGAGSTTSTLLPVQYGTTYYRVLVNAQTADVVKQ